MTRLGPLFITVTLVFGGCWFDGVAGDAKPLPEPTASEVFEESGDGAFLVSPVSAPIETDQEYRFELYTHCGLDAAPIDIDGSMWDFVGPGGGSDRDRPEGFENPSDVGTVTLVSENQLEFRSSSGAIAEFTRHEGAKEIPGCA